MDPVIVVRRASVADASELARLKIAFGEAGTVVPEDYVLRLADWIEQQGDRLLVRVAEDRGRLVGMAWLVVFERVPNPDAPVRLCADLQSVHVEPDHRGRGLGMRLVAALCADADRLGVPRTTVHSSRRAVALYERAGFSHDEQLLQRHRAEPAAAEARPPH